ncbi:Sodium bicarbonate transporter-like protein 11 [Strongyloides ratti]|uniref:Sodium bicarbonate transporter-like protein 11 n=1 Tax=Strongyloides ratti TaxID=34506 RepID=A0A090MZ12_STRRB|nr:Sodium bicarbonate transporter-like protein 11 [Strongyloides ratti]CEF68129.1 Sodium bicarbonate transporter-like protein 11 [Strongyloides ratti]
MPPENNNKFVQVNLEQLDVAKSSQQFLLSHHHVIHLQKNFSTEVRAILDIKKYIPNASIILNEKSTLLDTIINNLVYEIILNNNLEYSSYIDDVKEKIFNYSYNSEIKNSLELLCLKNVITPIKIIDDGIFKDQKCLTIYCDIENISQCYVGICKLQSPTNFSQFLESFQYISLVIGSVSSKLTKTSFEVGRTISTILSDDSLRLELEDINDKEKFKAKIMEYSKELYKIDKDKEIEKFNVNNKWEPLLCIINDFKRRWKYYLSDWWDGLSDYHSISKTISTTIYLFFIILLTTIALGMLNENNTKSKITVSNQILSQIIGGIFFSFFGGQPFLVLLSTAPITICISILYQISLIYNYNFYYLYTWTGIYTSIYLIIFALFQMSNIMKYAKKSLEELFGLFISISLIIKATQATYFAITRYDKNCTNSLDIFSCDRSSGLLFIIMIFGTLFISLWLFSFRLTSYLNKFIRDLVGDYSLPLAILIMTIIGTTIFNDIPKETFILNDNETLLNITQFWNLTKDGHILALQLAIPISILFFMDQLIVTRTVDNDNNKLKKGSTVNWDLFVVGILNIILSLLGLPWMHGALPQSYLHLRAQADVEEKIVDGVSVEVITKNRESRLAIFLTHILIIPTFIYFLPYLNKIPTAVYHGLFLNMALISMIGNKLIDRILLIFTQQNSYPLTSWIQKVPQKQIHLFTIFEIIQLLLLVCIGFSGKPFVELSFPIIIFLYIPLRLWILPFFFTKTIYLEFLDS